MPAKTVNTIAARVTNPEAPPYTDTHGSTTSLALELAQFKIGVHLVLPGQAPETPFAQSARRERMNGGVPEAYMDFAEGVFSAMQGTSAITRSLDVAEAVWRAATDPTCPLRLPAGAEALALVGGEQVSR